MAKTMTEHEDRRACTLPLVLSVFLVLTLSGCSQDASTASKNSTQPSTNAATVTNSRTPLSAFRLTDITSDTGIDFTYRNGEEAGHFAILESLGGGVAVLDFDLDGAEDVFVPAGGGFNAIPQPQGLPSALFRNLGSLRFTSVADPAGVAEPGHYSHGAAAADFDQDGFPDVLVTGYGGVQLWRNSGDGTFLNSTDEALLNDSQWSSSAAWGDLNGDRSLDLYVAHYVDWSFENHPWCQGPEPGKREVCPPRQYKGLTDLVCFSNGDGTFRDGTAEAGLSPEGKGLGVLLADLDLDTDLDVYVTNDTVENFLYQNEQGRLQDMSLLSGASVSDRGVPEGSMGVGLLDFNLDSLPDLWVVNYENEMAALYENLGQLRFRHVSERTEIHNASGRMFVGWGTCCFDVDLNGLEDIFVSNGHVIRYPINSPVEQLPLLLENVDAKRFRNVADTAGTYLSSPHKGRGAAVSDLNNDGRSDLIVSHNGQPVSILRNDTPPAGHWLTLDLYGTVSSRDAIGTLVTLVVGESRQTRQWLGGGSYASTSSRRMSFGVPKDHGDVILEIRWPSGILQTVPVSAIDQHLQIVERN